MLVEMYLNSYASYFLYNEPNVGPENKFVLELNHISKWQNAAKYSGSLAVVKTPQPPLLSVGFSLRSSSHTELQPGTKSLVHKNYAAGQVMQAHLAWLYAQAE